MKKLLAMATLVGAGLGISACAKKTYEIVLITDTGTIDDKSFNQGTWEGVTAYAKAENKTYKYIQPADKSTADYINAIELGIKGGAKTIVTPGFLFSEAIAKMHVKHQGVNFILIDATPDYTGMTVTEAEKKNVVNILYAEEEAGFLAGFAAVKAGQTNLGFIGGMDIPAVRKFGYGYVLGAHYASKDGAAVAMKYHYAGTFTGTADHKNYATGWYNGGVQTIFAAAGGVGSQIMKAAEEKTKNVIGVDIDQRGDSTSVITSALKQLSVSTTKTLENIYSANFSWGGTTREFNAANDGVGLAAPFDRVPNFEVTDYEAILLEVKNRATAGSSVDALLDAIYNGNELLSWEDFAAMVSNLNGKVVLEKL